MKKAIAIGLCVLLSPAPCFAQALSGFEAGPFNPNTPREREIQSGTGVGISRRAAPGAASSVIIGTTIGSTMGSTLGSTVGTGPGTFVGTTFGTSIGGPRVPGLTP